MMTNKQTNKLLTRIGLKRRIVAKKLSLVSDNQTQPSANCCTERMKGIIARTLSGVLFALTIEMAPMPVSIILAPKLAVAEKHMVNPILRQYKVLFNY